MMSGTAQVCIPETEKSKYSLRITIHGSLGGTTEFYLWSWEKKAFESLGYNLNPGITLVEEAAASLLKARDHGRYLKAQRSGEFQRG